MIVLSFHITLLQPVLVTALSGDPNSAVAFPYVPGSALRGAVIGRYLRHHPTSDLAADLDARRLFFDGTTRFLNAYPALIEGDTSTATTHRLLPTPRSLHRRKGEQKTVYDFAAALPTDGEAYQSNLEPFVLFGEETLSTHTPERHVAVHTQRSRPHGRSREESGAIYRYDALARNQTFEAAILCDTESDAHLLRNLLEQQNGQSDNTIVLGGSHSVDYGNAVISHITKSEASWNEAPSQPSNKNEAPSHSGDEIVLTLLSDTLLRNKHGQFQPDARLVNEAVENRVGVKLGEPLRSFYGSEAVGGFNRKWNLPLTQELALSMGSVFVYKKPVGGDWETLSQLGIGERRAEGFGRVAVDWHGGRKTWTVWQEEENTNVPAAERVTIPVDTTAYEVAGQMAVQMLRRRLDLHLIESANELGPKVKGPSNSQLGRLRGVVQHALRLEPAEGRNLLTTYLHNLDNRQSTRDQFRRGSFVDKMSLLEWITLMVSTVELQLDAFKDVLANLPQVGENVQAEPGKLAYEYNLRLVHETLARAAKHNDA